MQRVRRWLGRPESGTSLGALRIGFGAVQLWQTWEYVRPTSGVSSLDLLYLGKDVHFNFPYPGFEWVAPLPSPYLQMVFALIGLTSFTLMIGLASRVSALCNGLLFTYAWMLEANWWNNHFYLSSLFALLLAITPSGACLSVDRWWITRNGRSGTIWDGVIPFWPIFLFRAQLFIVYTFAALVKMNRDWFMGEPIRLWFHQRLAAKPLANVLTPDQMEQVYQILGSEVVVYGYVWGGLVFDLCIAPMLCIRRTQVLALTLVVLFHLSNFWIFMIGAFPFMAAWSTLIFLDSDWPIRVRNWVRNPTFRPPQPGWMLAGMLLIPLLGATLGWKLSKSKPPQGATYFPVPNGIAAFLAAWILLQALVPLRHFTIAGDVHWTLEGSRFAWQVMARVHVADIIYRVQDPSWAAPDFPPYAPIEWPKIDGQPATPIYHEVNACEINARELPEIVVTSEPWVRERVFYNPFASSAVSPSEIKRHVDQLWRTWYGRTPVVMPAISFTQVIQTIDRKILTDASLDESARRKIHAMCEQMLINQEDIRTMSADDPHRLEKTLDTQAMIPAFRTELRSVGRAHLFFPLLVQVKPFDLQSGDGQNWFQIVDPKLFETEAAGGDQEDDPPHFRWSEWKGDRTACVDWVRMPPSLMNLYPLLLFGYATDGQPNVVWNDQRDLVGIQLTFHGTSGVMIHQYVNGRIAPYWKEKTGVWPRVTVDAFLKLNQHPLQLLIDPNTDLASVPLSIWRHNPWILDQRYRNNIYHEDGQPRMRLEKLY